MIIILSIIIVALLVYKYVWPKNKYWEARGLHSYKIKVFISMKNIVHEVSDVYQKMKAEGHRVAGLYLSWEKLIFIADPLLIHHIFVENCDKSDNNVCCEEDTILLPIINANGDKQLFEVITNCAVDLVSALKEICTIDKEIEIGNMLSCYTSDIISSLVFGCEYKRLMNLGPKIHDHGLRAGVFSFKTFVKTFICSLFSSIAKRLKITTYDSAVHKFFTKAIQEVLEYRRKHNVNHQDIIQNFVNAGVSQDDTIKDTAAQVMRFFVEGIETAAMCITCSLIEIKRNVTVESKLRQEVCSVLEKYNYIVNYEALKELVYLDAVIQETLRMYPPRPMVRRTFTDPFNVPDSNIRIEARMVCLISIFAIHRDPEYYADPDLFDPERFAEIAENKFTDREQVYMPFGLPPKRCLGMQLALIEWKLSLALILLNFDYEICEGTKYPLDIVAPNGRLITRNGVWLKFSPLITSL